MGNQARQSQELELWQVVSSSGNRNVRTSSAKPRRSDMQRRGNVSNYNRAGTVDPRAAGARQRSGNRAGARISRNESQIRMMDLNASEIGRRHTGRNTGAQGTYARRTAAARPGTSRAAAGRIQTAGTRYAEPGRRRTSCQRTGVKTQAAKKKAGRRARISQFFAIAWIVAMSVAIIFMGKAFYQSTQTDPVLKADKVNQPPVEDVPVVDSDSDTKKPKIREDFLTISEYNRPGTKLASVKNIFVHYTANKGTSAAQNRSYFENLGQTHERAASAHFIIGYEGEIVQCIPLEEEAYAVVERNGDSISIECCFLEEDGSFTQETYDSLIKMLVWLTDKYGLEPKDILRHYDCGGKKCPIYYVEHEDAWQKLLEDVANYKL